MYKSLLVLTAALLSSSCAVNKESYQSNDQVALSGIELQHMDYSVRPQDDFYRFVNGQWLNDFQIPADMSYYATQTLLNEAIREQVKTIINDVSKNNNQPGTAEQKIADLYKTYMDVEAIEANGISSLAKEIKKINDISNNKELSEYMGYADIFFKAPIGIYIYLDDKNSSNYIVYVTQGGLGLPDRDYYFKEDDKSKNIQSKYQTHIGNMFTIAGMEKAEERALNIYALEKALAAGHWDRISNNDDEKTYNKMTFTEFAAKVPSMNWEAWLRHTMIAKPEFVVVNQPSYLETLNKVMNDTPLESWKDYFKWHLLSSRATSLTAVFEQEDFAFFDTVLSGTTEQKPRWKRGVDLVNRSAGELVGQVYVKTYFPPEVKTRVVHMVENLRDAFADGIENLDWMSAETKVQALDKLAKIDIKIGYPNVWRDYSKMAINGTDLMANKKEVTRFYTHRGRSKLGKAIDRSEWGMTPQTVNAYYEPSKNEVVFPAGHLQPPFFNLKADEAINYGAIGAIIGHEMAHGFDNHGSKYDGDGNRNNWWTEEDSQQFEKRTTKLIGQYDAFSVVNGTHVKGEMTLGENIGDLSGLSIAYKAFKANYKGNTIIDGYTADQRFFIGYAQVWMRKYRDEELLLQIETNVHSPGEFRVNGVLMNLPEFYQAFEVKPGDGMYLAAEERVKIW